jgi:hypothetical protein
VLPLADTTGRSRPVNYPGLVLWVFFSPPFENIAPDGMFCFAVIITIFWIVLFGFVLCFGYFFPSIFFRVGEYLCLLDSVESYVRWTTWREISEFWFNYNMTMAILGFHYRRLMI